MAGPLRAAWFDGRTSGSRPVLLHLVPGAGGPRLALHDPATGQALLQLEHRQVDWPERWGKRVPARLAVDLREHGSVVLDDPAAWAGALEAAGHRPGLVQRMQTRWTTLLAVLLVALAALGAFYRWGTPWAATQLTRQVPLSWELALAEQAIADLDARWLKPSKLPAARQQALRERFDALVRATPPSLRRYPSYAPQLRLQFRSGRMGANAFALPGGLVVMTDEMVEAAARHGLPDEALLGVLAHEAGHVFARHTTRMVMEQAVLNVGLGLALGDVSSLLSTGASLLTGLAYSRGHESEADCFAAALMRQAGLPTRPMADLLLAVERQARDGGRDGAAKQGGGDRRETRRGDWAALFSSHPDTEARALALQRGEPAQCH
jgi:Zn-dependent protease with chaperone function